MTDPVHTSAGSRIFIGTTSATPASDTFTEIGEVTNIPEFGRTYSQITHSSLANRNVRKFKGSRDDGNLQLDVAMAESDAGQQAADAALDSDFDYNFKVVANNPATVGGTPTSWIFQAKVMAFPTIIGTNAQITMRRLTLDIQSGTTTKTSAT